MTGTTQGGLAVQWRKGYQSGLVLASDEGQADGHNPASRGGGAVEEGDAGRGEERGEEASEIVKGEGEGGPPRNCLTFLSSMSSIEVFGLRFFICFFCLVIPFLEGGKKGGPF